MDPSEACGFRPMRGCHTALSEITTQWTGVKWYIEGDISNCFGSLDHEVMMSILREKLHDNRFLRLIQNLLQAGYLEEWRYHTTLSGCPQGGVISPILSNIYMDKLDRFVEQTLLPEYNRNIADWYNITYWLRMSVGSTNCIGSCKSHCSKH
jgi:retron-type reverse transcriptase